jgi:hypothetical protein
MSKNLLECQNCKELFDEKEIECSHDIPKYLGGTDKDGRHNLCKECHDDYEEYILFGVYQYLFNQNIIISNDRRNRIGYINKIKNKLSEIKNSITGDEFNKFLYQLKRDYSKETKK